MFQQQDSLTQFTRRSAYPPSARIVFKRAKSNVALANTHFAPSRSCTSALWTMTANTNPKVSTSKCRLRPLIFPETFLFRFRKTARVKAAFAALIRNFHRLTVDHRDTWFTLSSGLSSDLFSQASVQHFQCAVASPFSEVISDGAPRWEVAGQHSPGTAGSVDIQDGVKDAAHVGRAGTTTRFGLWKMRFDAYPLCI